MPASGAMTAWSDYIIDHIQRRILFLDLLRRRGNEEIAMESRPMATVLRFGHQVIMSGKSLPRPMNYSLSKITPPDGVIIDPAKRPVVVIDPRAGEGPGIGGFKAESEIGDALNAGHPVYFIGFSIMPEPGQQFLDVVEGQIKFFERVVALHPGAPLPFAIGNCQAGYQTLMIAMLRPDLFGICLLAGAPMSFWQGRHGENPMRYAGGLAGGSWLTALTSDLGQGQFDGTWLVLNFDKLGPANWLWGKQHEIFTHIDTGGPRYLEFEAWWGDFIQLGGDELQYLVDNLFIGDKLARNQLHARDGTVFDARRVTAPIIIFTSMGDNISPPQETLGWILDLYASVADIELQGQTIIYCLEQKIGHLALFVSAKIGAKEDAAFVQLMDLIDCLPPGLFEMVISPRPPQTPPSGFVTGAWITSFEARSLDDIRKIGRNSPSDDRAFATVARVSEINLTAYRRFMQPWVKAVASKPFADLAKALNPLRLSYTIFADRNPLMQAIAPMAKAVTAARRPVADDNFYLALQTWVSGQITTSLETYRKTRDQMQETMFFSIYGAAWLQAMMRLDARSEVRPPPPKPDTKQAGDATDLRAGGHEAALIRSVLFITADAGRYDEHTALALNMAHQQLPQLALGAFNKLARTQATLLRLNRDAALQSLSVLVPAAANQTKLLGQINAIIAKSSTATAEQTRRLVMISKSLS